MREEYKDEKGRKLKIWNGRGWGRSKYDENGNSSDYDDLSIACDHIYVCAHSVAEAVRLANEASKGHGGYITVNEVKNYWSNCWGNPMKGITSEVGVWVTGFSWVNKTPRKIL